MAGEDAVEGTPFGRYRLVRVLGRGGMGEVWRAYDTDTDRIVALKLLPAHLSEDDDFQRRFRREAHAAARLNDPHVIPIHHYGEIDGRLYVDMRLIEGRDLGTVIADGPLEPARAVRIIDHVAKALHAAHKVGLLHRDIKPSNIMLDDDDFAYLIDFGIARAADETRMTKSGHMIGTFQYIAPERLDSQIEEDARADIYSLACVLYEALTGEPPFAGTTTAQLMYAHVNTPPPRPSTAQPNVPKQVDQVIATGMAKDPDHRYATTVEFANAAHDAITAPIRQPAPPLSRPGTDAVPEASQPTRPASQHVAPPGAVVRDAAAPLRYAAAAAADRASATGPRKAAAKRVAPQEQEETASRPRWSRRRRMVVIVALVVLLVLAGLAIARTVIRSNYYVAEYNGTVSIVRGIQGSLLGMSLHEPYLVGCLNGRNELSLISYRQSGGHLDCRLMRLQDLRPAERAQIQAGLPGGTLDDAIGQLRELSANSLLPACPPPRAAAPSTTSSQTVTPLPPPRPEPGIDCRAVA
ncbi:serine/threonine-protein kinase [Mycobacterium sp. IS-2888]|uniref:serine/threonine-protein kinase n=1 Tax=Mycobacterium sp. IS-2888 TaxID=1834159 RepID=UPI00210FAE52|nr:serine/threonine-protein kinase [Mycobacterium sp. IS-2888]